LPTDAEFASLRIGDVYRDTQNGVMSNNQTLKIKTAL